MRIRTLGALAAGAGVFTYAAYRKDIEAARRRARATSQRILESPFGPIQFADDGDGPAVFVVHGAGGGFDQGLRLGRSFLGEHFRVIAPSRFGYLGTPLWRDSSPEVQADAHAWLLDALGLEHVPILGVSAGGPSAMQLCIRHPERCSALALVVPLAYAPNATPTANRNSESEAAILKTLISSDFVFWLATKVAHSLVVKMVLGTPIDLYRSAPDAIRRNIDTVMSEILPISERAGGLWNESIIGSNLTRYELEKIRVPVLVVSTEDDGYLTYAGARYTAEQTHGEFVGYPAGGHMLVGHEEELREKITAFVSKYVVPHAA